MAAADVAGVLPVIATPYDDEWQVDPDAIDAEIDWLYDNGADGIVVAMVSEVTRLAADERERLAETVYKINDARGPVVLSVSAESTTTAVRLARHAEKVGAALVMANPPLCTSATEDSLREYYEAVLDAVDIPLVVQDASGYMGDPLSLSLQARLLEKYGPVRVRFKPEVKPAGPRLTELQRLADGRASVFEGAGGLTLIDSYRRGIVGTMPGPDLVWAVAELWQALTDGREDSAYRIGGALAPLLSMLDSLDTYVAVEKYLLVKQGVLPSPRIRGPVGAQLDAIAMAEIERLFDRLAEDVRQVRMSRNCTTG